MRKSYRDKKYLTKLYTNIYRKSRTTRSVLDNNYRNNKFHVDLDVIKNSIKDDFKLHIKNKRNTKKKKLKKKKSYKKKL